MAYILTHSGTAYDFERPCLVDIHIRDIARSLSQTCRFTGHTRRFYSVAQHSVLVSYIVPPDMALVGLLHDAHEAYVGDVSTPLKTLLPDYAIIEQRAWVAVATRLGINPILPPDVKKADRILLATEKRDLMPRDERLWPEINNIVPLQDRIKPWHPEKALKRFLARYAEITAQAPAPNELPAPRYWYAPIRRLIQALLVGDE